MGVAFPKNVPKSKSACSKHNNYIDNVIFDFGPSSWVHRYYRLRKRYVVYIIYGGSKVKC